MFSTPKKHILISLIVALDLLLLGDIYQKREIIFSNGTAEATKIFKAEKDEKQVLGIRNVRRKARNTPTSIPTLKLSSTPTPTIKPSLTPKPTAKPSVVKTSPTPISKSNIPTPTAAVIKIDSSPNDNTANELLKQVNDFRSKNGKSSVTSESNTCSFANLRAGEIVLDFNHNGFRNRIDLKTLPYPGYSSIAENIAMNSNPNEVVPGWINSPGHAENMLRDVPHGCIGINGRYFTYEAWKP